MRLTFHKFVQTYLILLKSSITVDLLYITIKISWSIPMIKKKESRFFIKLSDIFGCIILPYPYYVWATEINNVMHIVRVHLRTDNFDKRREENVK